MATSKYNKKPTRTAAKPQEPAAPAPQAAKVSDPISMYLPYLIILLFTTAIYFNSIWDKYTIDDTLVLTDNKFTLQGRQGIQDILTKDGFVGFFGERGASLVSGGRYRPLSIVTMALEVETMGGLNPFVSHFINILLFGLTCLLLYHILRRLLPQPGGTPFYLTIPFIAAMLFAGHPIHTEAVANIKGRDEIMGMLFSLCALYASIVFVRKKQISILIWSAVFVASAAMVGLLVPYLTSVPLSFKLFDHSFNIDPDSLHSLNYVFPVLCTLILGGCVALSRNAKYSRSAAQVLVIFSGSFLFFLGLLSKENAITFLAIIPLTYYFFTKATVKRYAILALYIAAAATFLILRKSYTHSGLDAESTEILNNPFAYLPKTTEGGIMHYATVIYSFLLYYKLLVFPHPLTHDYYFNQIPYVGIGDVGFIVSAVVNLALIGYVIYGLIKKTVPAYAILFYVITFSVVSNLFFTVGIIMNERFVFMSSAGFCLLLAYLLVKALDKKWLAPPVLIGILSVILMLYSVKTISRNMAWHDNLTLFITDSKTSTRSAKVQMSTGGDLDKLADENFDTIRANGRLQKMVDLLDMNIHVADLPDSTIRKQIRLKSIEYLDTAIAIYPSHSNAWVLKGNVVYKLNHDVQEAMRDYENAAKFRVGGYYDAWYNMGCVQIENGMPELAKENFIKALSIDPQVFAARYNLAEAYGKLDKPDSALYWYKKTLEIKPLDDKSYYKMGTIYGKVLNNLDMAIQNISKAIDCNPKVPLYYEDLGVAYGLAHRYDEAIVVSNKCIEQFPDYVPAYMNLAVSYRNKGDAQKADMYVQKAQQLKAAGH